MSVIVMIALHVLAAGTVWRAFAYGVDMRTVAFAGSFYVASGLTITAGYHRLFAHRSYVAAPLLRWAFIIVGAACFQQSVIRWCQDHRAHHRFLDTDRDPYSVVHGFWWAHMGWLLFERSAVAPGVAIDDLQEDRLIRAQHHHYLAFAVASGLALPTALAWTWGDPMGGLLLAGVVRGVVLLQASCCVNSVAHRFGRPSSGAARSATDSWWLAVLTFGEGYHGRHHAHPGTHQFGPSPWQWDPGKWLITAATWFKLAVLPPRRAS